MYAQSGFVFKDHIHRLRLSLRYIGIETDSFVEIFKMKYNLQVVCLNEIYYLCIRQKTML
jgi:hypothetical protein